MGILKKHRGFTMVEMVLALLIVSMTSLTMAYSFSEGVDGYQHISALATTNQDARHALQRIRKELLVADLTDFIQISSTRLDFYDSSGQSNSLHLVGSNLYRGSDILIGNVNSLSFTYYDRQGNVTTNLPALWRIVVTVSVLPQGGNTPSVHRVDIFPRSMIYNGFA